MPDSVVQPVSPPAQPVGQGKPWDSAQAKSNETSIDIENDLLHLSPCREECLHRVELKSVGTDLPLGRISEKAAIGPVVARTRSGVGTSPARKEKGDRKSTRLNSSHVA